jgi:hypothetical protein
MSDKPQDAAQDTVDQQKQQTEHFDGQTGYGVEYQDGRYRSENMQAPPEEGRSGSYETQNTGGYGSGVADTESARQGNQQPEAPPDPEAQQGQGGQ